VHQPSDDKIRVVKTDNPIPVADLQTKIEIGTNRLVSMFPVNKTEVRLWHKGPRIEFPRIRIEGPDFLHGCLRESLL
jgi:hypothetical protein